MYLFMYFMYMGAFVCMNICTPGIVRCHVVLGLELRPFRKSSECSKPLSCLSRSRDSFKSQLKLFFGGCFGNSGRQGAGRRASVRGLLRLPPVWPVQVFGGSLSSRQKPVLTFLLLNKNH